MEESVCFQHPSLPGVSRCHLCGNAICRNCLEIFSSESGEYAGKALCYDCTSKMVAVNKVEADKIKKKATFGGVIWGIISGPFVEFFKGIYNLFGGSSDLATGNFGGGVRAMKGLLSMCFAPFKAIYNVIVSFQQKKKVEEIIASDAQALQVLSNSENVTTAELRQCASTIFANSEMMKSFDTSKRKDKSGKK